MSPKQKLEPLSSRKLLIIKVGTASFELTASCTPTKTSRFPQSSLSLKPKLPTRSQILEKENGELEVIPNSKGEQRSIEAINRPVEMLRVMLNYAVDERMISPE